MVKTQILDREPYLRDVTAYTRDDEVAMRKAERTDKELIRDKKVMTYKTATP